MMMNESAMNVFTRTSKYMFSGLIALTLWAAFASGVKAAEVAPDELVRTTTQKVVAILKKDQDLQADSHKVYALVDAEILPHFDFNRMTMLAVGKHWQRATPAQRQSLIKEFRTLLVRTYASSLTAFNNQEIEFKPFSLPSGATDATVRTQVRQPGAQPIPIDYRMEKTPFGWKVYDVAVDGVSMVTNYRGSFSSEIRQSGIDGLLRTLVNRNQRIAQNPSKASDATSVKKPNTAPE